MAHRGRINLTEHVRDLGASAVGATLDLLYPPNCPVCEADLDREAKPASRFVCANCLQRVERDEPPWCAMCGVPLDDGVDLCARCGQTTIPFEQARSVGPYDGPLARLIQLYKFGGERALAQDLAALLADRVVDEGMADRIDVVTYVPMTRKALRDRGFNHVERLARELGDLIDRPVVSTLRKTRETRPQIELRERERLDNLKGAFAAVGPLPWDSVLLIDDVFTTGTTVRECTQALLDGGVEQVYVATLARTAEDTY